LKAGPRDPSAKPQVRSATTSGPRPAPKVSLPIAPSAGAARAAIGYFRFLNDCAFTLGEVFDPCLLLVLGTRDAGAIILVGREGFFFCYFCYLFMFTFFQALDLAKSQSTQQVVRIAEIEEANALLQAELDTAHSKLVEVEQRERTLTSENEEVKRDLESACTTHDVVEKEKALV
jgi:hypothetical protein